MGCRHPWEMIVTCSIGIASTKFIEQKTHTKLMNAAKQEIAEPPGIAHAMSPNISATVDVENTANAWGEYK